MLFSALSIAVEAVSRPRFFPRVRLPAVSVCVVETSSAICVLSTSHPAMRVVRITGANAGDSIYKWTLCLYLDFRSRNSDAFSGFTLAGKDCTGTDPPVITLISLLTHAVIVQNRPHTR